MKVGFPNRLNAPINWQHRGGKAFWGEISPCEHLLQIYEDERILLDTLEGFVSGGLELGEGVVLIVTPAHLKAIEQRLWTRGLDLEAARADDQYIPLDAQDTLATFMRKGWPQAEIFKPLMLELLNRARGRNWRKVRAFGEMVALLWAEGNSGATIRLEHLWHDLCKAERFSLLCAYPLGGFEKNAAQSMNEIRAAHSNTIVGHGRVRL